VELIPFISPDDLEAMMGEPFANPTDLMIAIALDASCQTIRTYLGQDINLVEDDVEIHSGSGRRKMRLRQRPVRAVTQIKVDGTVVPLTSISVRGAILTWKDLDWWTPGNDNIEVTYDHGWDVEEPTDMPVPADIRLVALLLSRRAFESSGAGGAAAGAIVSETIGDYSYTLSEEAAASALSAAELLDAEKSVLDRYRIELVGDTPTY
jgi:hypothetical protein